MEDLYAILDSFGLSNKAGLSERLATWGDEEFERFFETYEKAAKNRSLVQPPMGASTSVFVDSIAGSVPISMIRQFCIYADRFYIHDPILPLRQNFMQLDTDFPRIISSNTHEGRIASFRTEMRHGIEPLLEIRPLVEAGVIHITASDLLRNHPEPGGIYHSDFYGPKGQWVIGETSDEGHPPELARYVNDHLVINPFRFDKNGRPIIENKPADRTNSIAVWFDDNASPRLFCLSDVRLGDRSTESYQHLQMHYTLDGSGDRLDGATFYHWMVGESRKYVRQRMNDLYGDLMLASIAKAHFLTPYRSSRDLATISLEAQPSPNPVLSSLLSLDLPFLSDVSMRELAKARANEAAFSDFRVALDKAFSKFESLSAEERQLRTDEIIRDLLDAPLARLDTQLKTIAKHAGIQAAIIIGSLSATLLTGPVSPTTALLGAAAMGVASYRKERGEADKLMENPSFFYWDVTKNARKRNKVESAQRAKRRKR